MCKQIRVTRREVLTLLCSRLSWQDPNTARRQELIDELHWKWFGILETHGTGLLPRKFVGIDVGGSTRRDFVRVSGPLENNTCLTAQILAFVEIRNFNSDTRVLATSKYEAST